MSSIINYNDRNTCPIFGDGAAADAVVMEENRQFGYLNPCTDDTVIRQKSGQVVAGGAIGVLCHEKIWFPTLPGNVMNA